MSFWKSVIISAIVGGIVSQLFGNTVGTVITLVLAWNLYDPDWRKNKNKHYAD